MKCMNMTHDCVFMGCSNHAVYSHQDIVDNYCFTHMMQTDSNWKNNGWYKERCRRKLYTPKEHFKLVEREIQKQPKVKLRSK